MRFQGTLPPGPSSDSGECSNVVAMRPEQPERSTSVWRRRWLPVLLTAVALGSWPACNSHVARPADPAVNLDFTLKDMHGADVRLADFRGKPMLINFWATWCGPCKAETPWFVELAAKYRDRGFTVIGISVDDVPEDIKAFAAEYQVAYPMLVGKDHPELAKAFGAEDVLPVTWLVRADGKVQAKVTGIHGKDWFDTQIQQLF
jgi:peroxiredoxin